MAYLSGTIQYATSFFPDTDKGRLNELCLRLAEEESTKSPTGMFKIVTLMLAT
jgi:hypothetical protein